MTLTELNKEHTKRYNKIFNDSEVFWAFGENQWQEAKEKYSISEDNKVVSIGGGGYVLAKNIDKLNKDLKTLKEWYSEEEKKLTDKIRLKRISEQKYEDMLCVLPPIMHANGVFQVSEPYDHVTLGGNEYARYGTYQQKGNNYYYLGILTKMHARAYAQTGCKVISYK